MKTNSFFFFYIYIKYKNIPSQTNVIQFITDFLYTRANVEPTIPSSVWNLFIGSSRWNSFKWGIQIAIFTFLLLAIHVAVLLVGFLLLSGHLVLLLLVILQLLVDDHRDRRHANRKFGFQDRFRDRKSLVRERGHRIAAVCRRWSLQFDSRYRLHQAGRHRALKEFIIKVIILIRFYILFRLNRINELIEFNFIWF